MKKKASPQTPSAPSDAVDLPPEAGFPEDETLYEPLAPSTADLESLARMLFPGEEAEEALLAVRLYAETHPAMRERLKILRERTIDSSGTVPVADADELADETGAVAARRAGSR